MTNKINGIDVSGAELYEKNVQLQKENEELRQVRKNSPDIQEPYVYLYRQIKKQCHKLEQENEELKICFTSTDINAKRIQTKLFDKEEECKKYKQALEEIRDILKEERADIKTVYVRRTYNRLNKIQNKIDEVLEDN